MPIGLLKASFAGVFEEFVHRREHYARAFHVQPQIKIEFVVKKMNVAVAEHTKEGASGFEILGVNDAVLDGEFGVCFVRDAVSAPGNDVVQNSCKRAKNRYAEPVPVAYFNLSAASHRSPSAAQTVELIRAA